MVHARDVAEVLNRDFLGDAEPDTRHRRRARPARPRRQSSG